MNNVIKPKITSVSKVIRINIALFFLIQTACWSSPSSNTIDTFKYWFPTFEKSQDYFIRNDIFKTEDPDGLGRTSYFNGKFGNPQCYEIFIVTKEDINIRYEKHMDWFRRYEERSPEYKGKCLGNIWLKRYMTPGYKNGFITNTKQDYFKFNEAEQKWIYQERPVSKQYVSIDIVDVDYGKYNQTDYPINKVMRRTDEWQTEGKIFEQYDYAKGLGLVNWRWIDRIDLIKKHHVEKLADGDLYKCGYDGYNLCFIPTHNNAKDLKEVYSWNDRDKVKGRPLELIRFKSHWSKDNKNRVYVISTDLSKERILKLKKKTRGYHQYLDHGDTRQQLSDMPYHKTTPSRHFVKHKQ